ncbi:DUF421 domain-containing protein [Salinithrix halophila]|uniref:DUF421 domain-containing protein n=1 Tax=Salinithrix halophila TaxID=1485204 RepID=A0ABV8JM61_9BACL
MQWIWQAISIVLVGTVLLRVAGRKTISQMTLSQTVLMISIGTLLIQPVSGHGLGVTFLVASILVISLLIIEYLQLKSDTTESLITGKAVMVIQNGQLQTDNLKKLRLTVDQLETRLRQNSVTKFTDVKWATLEPSGQLGYELMDQAKPATKGDLNQLLQTIQSQLQPVPAQMNPTQPTPNLASQTNNNQTGHDIFAEVTQKNDTDHGNLQ